MDKTINAVWEALSSRFPDLVRTSGDRSPAYNAQVGGARGSQHIHGRAIDLDLSKLAPEQRALVVQTALSSQGPFANVHGAGMYGPDSTSLHLDARPQAGLAAWGPDRHRGSIGQTPDYFQQAVAGYGGAAPPQPQPQQQMAQGPLAAPPPQQAQPPIPNMGNNIPNTGMPMNIQPPATPPPPTTPMENIMQMASAMGNEKGGGFGLGLLQAAAGGNKGGTNVYDDPLWRAAMAAHNAA